MARTTKKKTARANKNHQPKKKPPAKKKKAAPKKAKPKPKASLLAKKKAAAKKVAKPVVNRAPALPEPKRLAAGADTRGLMTLEEVAKFMAVSVRQVRKWIEEHEFHPYDVSTHGKKMKRHSWRLLHEEVQAFLRRRRKIADTWIPPRWRKKKRRPGIGRAKPATPEPTPETTPAAA